jgi:hypothetical protein
VDTEITFSSSTSSIRLSFWSGSLALACTYGSLFLSEKIPTDFSVKAIIYAAERRFLLNWSPEPWVKAEAGELFNGLIGSSKKGRIESCFFKCAFIVFLLVRKYYSSF